MFIIHTLPAIPNHKNAVKTHWDMINIPEVGNQIFASSSLVTAKKNHVTVVSQSSKRQQKRSLPHREAEEIQVKMQVSVFGRV